VKRRQICATRATSSGTEKLGRSSRTDVEEVYWWVLVKMALRGPSVIVGSDVGDGETLAARCGETRAMTSREPFPI